jgi:septum formation protein
VPFGARPPLVLASASPRRLSLLAQIGVVPDLVLAADVDETPHRAELPAPLAQRLADAKASVVRSDVKITTLGAPPLILAADTVVALGRRILPKATNESEARQCLTLLSGRRHRVLTAVTLALPDGTLRRRLVESQVRFKRLAPAEIARYLKSGEWQGKAGGYGIQGLAAAYIPWISGSYSNVVGLPLAEIRALLDGVSYFEAIEPSA